MPGRNFKNYVGIPRWGRVNMRYSLRSREGAERSVPATPLNRFSEFFTNNVIAWFVHTWRVREPFVYPENCEECVHNIEKAAVGSGQSGSGPQRGDPGSQASGPVVIAVAADWATDTLQSEFIGRKIGEKNPDYTIHMGDTYYSGTVEEIAANFGPGMGQYGSWPRGRSGTFALLGNHEMFSSGTAYLDMITHRYRGFGIGNSQTGHFSGQGAPFFGMYTTHWLILGLDTGYDSLHTGILQLQPNNEQLQFPPNAMTWLKRVIAEQKGNRGIIVLTHHQYVTAFHGETEFTQPAQQLNALLPDTKGILWIWGHEHRFAMYGKNQLPGHVPAFGRCIGNGGMPDEHTPDRYVVDPMAVKRHLVLYDKRTADSIPLGLTPNSKKMDVGFNGYAMIRLHQQEAEITYYASYKKDDPTDAGRDEAIVRETWQVDPRNGQISAAAVMDLTAGKPPQDRVTYFGASDPRLVSQ